MVFAAEELLTKSGLDGDALDRLLGEEQKGNNRKIVVLDDDPTGVQTVHDISVYTDWDPESMREAFAEEGRLFYILTNSRGMTAKESEKIHREIADAVDAAAKESGWEYLFISRSDSTLRGHYPLETRILREAYEKNTGATVDGEILCPFFPEGGRYTVGNVHYVRYGDSLIPANETEFAADKTFGYQAATLPEYVEEKTGGEFKKEDVRCISLELLRKMDFDALETILSSVNHFGKVIVNAVEYEDLKVFCIALYRAMKRGKTFLFRTAAAFVKVMGGVSDQPLLTREDLGLRGGGGGLIIAGSHTDKTKKQLNALAQLPGVRFVEMDVSLIFDEKRMEEEIGRCLEMEEKALENGETVCCHTSGNLITAGSGDKEDDLRISVRISEAVCRLAGDLKVKPEFIVAKGGITSSDIGTKALKVKRALVMGQIRPGIPVWRTGEESRFPGLPYIIFPGNVGGDETLRDVVKELM